MDIRIYKKTILPALESYFIEKRIGIPPQKDNIFLCGAVSTDSQKSGRFQLKEHFSQHYADAYDFIIADDISGKNDSEDDLLTQENILGDYSDCIIIILESESAFAELGAFANHKTLVEKLLIVNDKQFKGKKSFINKGPIQKINKLSTFKGEIFFKTKEALLEITEPLIAKLQDNLPKNYKFCRFEKASDLCNDSIYPKRIKMVFVSEVLRILTPISLKDFVKVFNLLTKIERTTIEEIISICLSLNYFREFGGFLVATEKKALRLKSDDSSKIRAIILQEYLKHDKERMNQYFGFIKEENLKI
ncbi:retron St85 family effector protein [uncultured Sphaerochaeta sp.]|uniref:retron St85 family effector protein n=1 Tax=uncultured Sphaerochaeta sp. TaxID=886478 RepID=UPI002A0A57D9|nr:retron St85 family effector protein [uncultured Sphaerochaeta sp.]